MNNTNKKLEKARKEVEKLEKYEKGVSWYDVQIESDTEIETHLIADELGSDVIAHEMVTEAKREGKKAFYNHLKDIIY